MSPELKVGWVAALRSDEYEQGRGGLRDSEGGHCCIGVLADLIDPNGWDGWDGWDERYSDSIGDSWKGQTGSFSREYAESICLPYAIKTNLECMNDGIENEQTGEHFDPCDFEEIADYIEEHL